MPDPLFSRRLLHAVCLAVACIPLLFLASAASAQLVVVADDFESGVFSPDWDATAGSGIALVHDPGGAANGSDYYARIEGVAPLNGGLGVSLAGLSAGSQIASDFQTTFDFRIGSSAQQQFGFSVSGFSSVPNASISSLNLRYQSSTWAAFDTTSALWQPIAGLGGVQPDEWNSFAVIARDWGTGLPGQASYDLSVTNHIGVTTTANSLRFFRRPDIDRIGARSVSWNDLDGNNPGYDLDNVVLTATPGFPPPPSRPPQISLTTLNPIANTSPQVLEFDPRTDSDRPFSSGSAALAPTAFNAALKANPNASVNKGSVMPLMLTEERIGRASQGADGVDAYTFGNWQYIDKFVSWGGRFDRNVTAPGQAWIDAAHRNGVKIYGNVFLPPIVFGGDQNQLDYLTQKDVNGRYVVADRLIEIAETQGFDGWFLNQETNTNTGTAGKVALLMDYWQANSDVEIIWYDAMNESGSVGWQDRLNTANDRFFQSNGEVVSESMFLDFGQSQQGIQSSRTLANSLGRSEFDVYAGANVEGGGIAAGANAINQAFTAGPGGGHATSIGLFRPDNESYDTYAASGFDIQALIAAEDRTYVGAARDPSNTSGVVPGTGAWRGIAHHVAAKTPLVRDRFVSNFNYGVGTSYAYNGEQVSAKAWNNMGAQDVLPTWRWIVETNSATPVSVAFDFDDAYIGGNSIRISGALDAQTDVPLYLTEAPVHSDSQIALVYKTGAIGDPSLKVYVTLQGDESNRIVLDVGPSANDGWNEALLDLSAFADETISSIGVRLTDADVSDYDLSIGQIGLLRGERDLPAPATNLRTQEEPFPVALGTYEMRLLWDHSSDHSSNFADNNLYYYNIYQVFENGEDELLGVTGGEGYWINDLTREGGASVARIAIDAVSLEFGVTRSLATLDWGTLLLSDLTLPGDYNDDGLVDAADYTVWRDTLGDEVNLRADGNNDGLVDPEDLDIWKSNYGRASSQGSMALRTVVPEPSACVVAALAIVLIVPGSISRCTCV